MIESAFLHFRIDRAGPFQTISVPLRTRPTPWKGRTQTGYGPAIPTDKQVKWAGRWYSVKIAVYANAGTAYIGKPGAWIATVQEY